MSNFESTANDLVMKSLATFRFPKFEAHTSVAPISTVYLIDKKGDLPAQLLKGLPVHLREHGALRGEAGSLLVMHGHGPQGGAASVVLGIGKQKEFNSQEAAEWGEAVGHRLNKERIKEIQVLFPDSFDDRSAIFNFLKGMGMANFKVLGLKSKQDNPPSELSRVVLGGVVASRLEKTALDDLSAILRGLGFARELSDLPPSYATPQLICSRFQDAIDTKNLSVEIWDEKRIAKEKMGLLMAVSQGSAQPPRFLIVRYGKDYLATKKHLFLVGKGITFDTGGINLKTTSWQDLVEMKKDMSGAASVLGAMLALAHLRPELAITAVTPLTFNSIGSKAVLPSDIVHSYAGKTVEIKNTDAEGRLILADALHYAVTQKADYIVDVATLTGACMLALGAHYSGVMSNNEHLQQIVIDAASAAGEPAWPLPMSARYGAELKSDLADFSNMGKTRNGGAQIAGKFLEKFVEQTPWAHLDIAGTMDLGDIAAGGAQVKTPGRMVHALVETALRLAQEHNGKGGNRKPDSSGGGDSEAKSGKNTSKASSGSGAGKRSGRG